MVNLAYIKYYNKAIKEDDTYADAWLGKAIALDHLGHPLDAYRNIKQAIKTGDVSRINSSTYRVQDKQITVVVRKNKNKPASVITVWKSKQMMG